MEAGKGNQKRSFEGAAACRFLVCSAALFTDGYATLPQRGSIPTLGQVKLYGREKVKKYHRPPLPLKVLSLNVNGKPGYGVR